MKKLLAILLSALMLCAMIPFAAVSVSAADDYYIELVADAEELNAGDEFTIEVSLYGHESVGLIGAIVEVGYDRDVFEQVATYDEDEEMWIPVEVASKFNASSNKYITFPPVNEETGKVKSCLATYLRSTATATQAVKTNLFYTATFRVKDDAPSGNYTFQVVDHNDKNIILHGNQTVAWSFDPIEVSVNGTEAPSCKHEYDNACDVDCNLCYEPREVEHSVKHVAAVAPTCTDMGNIEYWYCDVCGMAWLNAECTQNTNLRAVVLPVNENAHTYLYACDQYCYNCGEKTNPRAQHNILHVEAKAPISCIEFGNVEYWYCEHCHHAWLDEACTYETNMKRVQTAGPCISNAEFACQDGECINCGLPYAADVEHTYANAHDASCDVCGTVRELVLAAQDIILKDTTSVSELKNGLAFKFNVAINGITWSKEYLADYTNATVTIDGEEYKLVAMGAIANNKGYAAQTLEDVDGIYVQNVPAVKVFEDSNGATSYAVRIINIPAEHLDSEITVCSYLQYEVDGEIVTVYGEDWSASYNSAR